MKTQTCPHCECQDIANGTKTKWPKYRRKKFVNHLLIEHGIKRGAGKLFDSRLKMD
jgi:hypothetical protein